MGKFFTIIMMFSFCKSFVFAQTSYSIKEQYDYLDIIHAVIPANYLDPTIPYDCNNGLSTRLGDRVSDVMHSYIKMYKTTKDKAYLVKFSNLCVQVQSLKMANNISNNPPVNAPIWATDDCMYENGRILAPMAEFVHLIKIDDQNLQTVQFPVSLVNNANFNTYNDFADWLAGKVSETLNYMIDYYWIDDSKAFSKKLGGNAANEINQQSSFGVALFYLGHSYPTSYNTPPYNCLHKADAIALLYKTDVNLFEDNDCPFGQGECFALSVLEQLSNNSYIWYSNGWRVIEHFHVGCIGNNPNRGNSCEYSEYIEDISHAIPTLLFARVLYEYIFSSSIDVNDMTRWRNAFAKNVYDGSGNFYNNVFGTNTSLGINSSCAPDNCPLNHFRTRSLGWMPFYKFDAYDSSPIPLYDIVMNYYVNGIPGDPTTSTLNYPVQNIPEGQDYLGLSEVVAAQWDRECVNLSLYNRQMIYDQDFHVKNKLIVEPLAGTGSSFADPVITTPEFTIEPGVTVNMTAGEEIRLKPGFRAKAGSEFRARIIPSSCTDGMAVSGGNHNSGNHNGTTTDAVEFSNPNNNKQNKKDSLLEREKQDTQLQVNITPNPNDGVFSVSMNELKTTYSVSVTDVLGNEIFQSGNNTGGSTIDIASFPKGIYFVKVTDVYGKIFVRKIVTR